MPNLEDLKNGAIIDTTAGQVTSPIEGIGGTKKTLRETDPAFTPTKGFKAEGVKRTPIIEGAPPKITVEPRAKADDVIGSVDGETPPPPPPSRLSEGAGPNGFQVVQASFDSKRMVPFDYHTLPKKEQPIGIHDRELVEELNAAVAREKEAITERVNALTEAQRQELEAMNAAAKEGRDPRSIYDGRDPTPDDSEYHLLDNMNVEKLTQDIKEGRYNQQVPDVPDKEEGTVGKRQEPSTPVETEDIPENGEIEFEFDGDEDDDPPAAAEPASHLPEISDEEFEKAHEESEPVTDCPYPIPETKEEEEKETMTEPEVYIDQGGGEPDGIAPPHENYDLPSVEEATTAAAEDSETSETDVEIPSSDDMDEEEGIQDKPEVESFGKESAAIESAGLFSGELEQDIGEEVPEEEEGLTQDEIIKNFASEVKSRIGRKNRINLRDFKIVRTDKVTPLEAITGMQALTSTDWVYPSINRCFSCTGLTGPELLKMNPENDQRSRINILQDMYAIIYEHITSPKPSSYEKWLKTVRFADLDHLFFGLFKATFADSNFMHYECRNPKCKHVYIEDISFDDMIKYEDDEVKKNIAGMLTIGDYSPVKPKIKLYQATDTIVFGIRNPSIYNVIIETASLSDTFMKKYNELIDMIMYIENVFIIDPVNKQLHEVDLEPDPESMAKTIAHRIRNIYSIMRKLNSTEYYELRKAIADTVPNNAGMSYRVPASKCKKCGAEIPEIAATGQELLFLRHQLGAYVVL